MTTKPQSAVPDPSVTIAVVIPLYNKGRWVEETLGSVLSQERQPDEIIVVDDGSTDEGPNLVKRIAGSRARLLRTRLPQSGPSAARNAGIRAARSDWIALLDADDLWSSDYLAKVAQAIHDDPNVGCVFSSRAVVGSEKMFQHPPTLPDKQVGRLDLGSYLDLWIATGRTGLSPMHSSSCVIRKSILLAAGLFPEGFRRGEDKDTWLRVMAITTAVHLPEPLARYRRDLPGQLNRGPSPEQMPPLLLTARALAGSAEIAPRVRAKLRQLASREAWLYGKRRRLRPFDKAALAAVDFRRDPLRFCLLGGLYGAGAMTRRLTRLRLRREPPLEA